MKNEVSAMKKKVAIALFVVLPLIAATPSRADKDPRPLMASVQSA